MRNQQSRPKARRSRRGGRGRRRNTNQPHGGRNGRSPEPTRKKAIPRTLWQRIVAFFGGLGLSRDSGSNGRSDSIRGKSRRQGREPEVVEVTSPKVYVGNLSYDATESDLYDLFNGVGSVRNAEIVCHRETQRSKGFAFVMMTTTNEAQRAVVELHDKEFMGRKLVVSGARSNDLMHCR